jgi:hypothetical protein
MKKCRTNAEIANFIIGCSDASQLQDEIQAIINDEPLDVDRLEPRLREAIGAVNESCRNGSVYLNRLRYGARISHPTASTDFRIKPPVPDRPSHARPSLYLRHIVRLSGYDVPGKVLKLSWSITVKLPRRIFLHLAAGTAAQPLASNATVLAQGTITQTGAIRIVERTHYYAKPGLAAEVP